MQGHAFAGTFQSEPQPFIFGFRGRMDERLDFVRSVTDGRYVYLRNFFPHVSQGQHVSYQFETPTTQVWRQLFDEGKTNDAQSIFWRVPKAPEELYDLQTDPDEVRNLAASAEHQEVLRRLRQAVRERMIANRDLGFLPEGEIHSRSQGTTPQDMGRDEQKYPLTRIMATAELASSLESGAESKLTAALSDTDSAVRYWGALGLMMRGASGVQAGRAALASGLKDDSPYVRVIAAQALVQFGNADDLKPALDTLGQLAPSDKNGVFVSILALNAIDSLGQKAAPLLTTVRTITAEGPSPHNRYDSYVPRLVADITTNLGGEAPTPPAAKAKAKGKKGKAAK